jgi:hypothetical protein
MHYFVAHAAHVDEQAGGTGLAWDGLSHCEAPSPRDAAPGVSQSGAVARARR